LSATLSNLLNYSKVAVFFYFLSYDTIRLRNNCSLKLFLKKASPKVDTSFGLNYNIRLPYIPKLWLGNAEPRGNPRHFVPPQAGWSTRDKFILRPYRALKNPLA